MDLRIAHLYPDLMSIYGDRGNVIALEQRARWRGIDVETRAYTAGDAFDADWPVDSASFSMRFTRPASCTMTCMPAIFWSDCKPMIVRDFS